MAYESVFLVKECGGEYEDKYQHIKAAFYSQETAEKVVGLLMQMKEMTDKIERQLIDAGYHDPDIYDWDEPYYIVEEIPVSDYEKHFNNDDECVGDEHYED